MGKLAFIFLVLFINNTWAKCQLTEHGLLNYEKVILAVCNSKVINMEKSWEKMAPAIYCIQEIKLKAPFLLNSFAASSLEALFSGSQLGTDDARFKHLFRDGLRHKNVSNVIKNILGLKKSLLFDSFLNRQKESEWVFYENFCDESQQSICAGLLPDKSDVLTLHETSALVSVLILKKSLMILHGKHREFVQSQIKSLYEEVPKEKKLLRKLINEVYDEISPVPVRIS